MLADRIAASRVYKGKDYTDAAPYDYFVTHMAIRNMNPKSIEIMKDWLLYLKLHGEKETFKYIKKNYPHK